MLFAWISADKGKGPAGKIRLDAFVHVASQVGVFRFIHCYIEFLEIIHNTCIISQISSNCGEILPEVTSMFPGEIKKLFMASWNGIYCGTVSVLSAVVLIRISFLRNTRNKV